MGVRREVRADDDARKAFVSGVLALKQEQSGLTTAELGLPAPSRPVSTYDLFVVWHHLAMHRMTPPDQSDRNAAHSGPAFLPWHRLMLLLFELQVQRVLGSPDFGLPYWDWSADGDLPTAQQSTTALWRDDGVGGTGDPVADGPFRADEFTVRLESDALARLVATERPLARELGVRAESLPTSGQQALALQFDDYDTAPWDSSSAGFRNRLEGWPDGPSMHNRVHVWIGGDMLRASSPNDPVFFLNHANVDRLWESWMREHGRNYIPGSSAPAVLNGHRRDDPLYSILIEEVVTPADMLDIAEFATYDALP